MHPLNYIREALNKNAESKPDAIAVSSEKSEINNQELLVQFEELHHAFSQLPPSLSVYLALPGGPEFTSLQLALLAAGHIAIPIPFKLTQFEAKAFFSQIVPDILCLPSIKNGAPIIEALPNQTTILVLDGELSFETNKFHAAVNWKDLSKLKPKLKPKQSLDPRIGLVQFTSGSTGAPKAIALSWSNIEANQSSNLDYLASYNSQPVFCPIPQFHAMGNSVVLEHLLTGSGVHLANSFLVGEHFKRLKRFECHAILGSPNYFRMLLKLESFSPDNLRELGTFTIGTDWIDEALLAAIRHRFPKSRIVCRYGLSEAVGALFTNILHPGKNRDREGHLGTKVLGVEIDGPNKSSPHPISLRVRAANVAIGKITNNELVKLTDENGFLDTGDLVETNDTGEVFLSGRDSQFIKHNGFRINPYEIEEVLRKFEGIEDAVVVGLPHKTTGQSIAACVSTKDGKKLELAEITKHCLAALSSYKLPTTYHFNTKIPQTHSGKPARKQLADLLLNS